MENHEYSVEFRVWGTLSHAGRSFGGVGTSSRVLMVAPHCLLTCSGNLENLAPSYLSTTISQTRARPRRDSHGKWRVFSTENGGSEAADRNSAMIGKPRDGQARMPVLPIQNVICVEADGEERGLLTRTATCRTIESELETTS
jgi:hypothetical protein